MLQASRGDLANTAGQSSGGARPPQETHYPERPPAPSLMEVKDLVALPEREDTAIL